MTKDVLSLTWYYNYPKKVNQQGGVSLVPQTEEGEDSLGGGVEALTAGRDTAGIFRCLKSTPNIAYPIQNSPMHVEEKNKTASVFPYL